MKGSAVASAVAGTSASASSGEGAPIAPATLRNLADKTYEKRKAAAQEIEGIVRDAKERGDRGTIETVIELLSSTYVYSTQSNPRKGGILGLAACAIGLGNEASTYLGALAPPVLKCFTDSDSKIRFYACESLYNIAKVSRAHMLAFFNDVFDGLCRLSADPDQQVVNGAGLLDRLMKDIVSEGQLFDINHFIPLLKDRSTVLSPQVRQFLLSWISVLDSVPEINMVYYLPEYLEGIFRMLSDKKLDIRTDANNVLGEFLRQIIANPQVLDLGRVILILVPFCTAPDECTQLAALHWIISFLELPSSRAVLPYAADILSGVLPCVSQENSEVANQSLRANKTLQDLIVRSPTEFPLDRLLDVVIQQFVNRSVPTRLSALNWILRLHERAPDELFVFMDLLYPVLLKTLTDSAEDVVSLDLEVLAKLTRDKTYFRKLMDNLVSLFSTDQQLLESRGSLIIRQLCLHIRPRKIYKAIAHVLIQEEDFEFCSLMVQTLSIILLTSGELVRVREALKNLADPQNRKLFCTLYRSWSHNSVSTLALCLYARAYEHAAGLVAQFSTLEVTVSMLLEIDRLVQLLESPIYTDLRLHLLEPSTYPHLYKCLYALMMLLPQTSAFNTLKNRLGSVAPIASLRLLESVSSQSDDIQQYADIDFKDLMAHFVALQRRHEEKRLRDIQDKAARARQQAMHLQTSARTPSFAAAADGTAQAADAASPSARFASSPATQAQSAPQIATAATTGIPPGRKQ